jgi:hypothetical protein
VPASRGWTSEGKVRRTWCRLRVAVVIPPSLPAASPSLQPKALLARVDDAARARESTGVPLVVSLGNAKRTGRVTEARTCRRRAADMGGAALDCAADGASTGGWARSEVERLRAVVEEAPERVHKVSREGEPDARPAAPRVTRPRRRARRHPPRLRAARRRRIRDRAARLLGAVGRIDLGAHPKAASHGELGRTYAVDGTAAAGNATVDLASRDGGHQDVGSRAAIDGAPCHRPSCNRGGCKAFVKRRPRMRRSGGHREVKGETALGRADRAGFLFPTARGSLATEEWTLRSGAASDRARPVPERAKKASAGRRPGSWPRSSESCAGAAVRSATSSIGGVATVGDIVHRLPDNDGPGWSKPYAPASKALGPMRGRWRPTPPAGPAATAAGLSGWRRAAKRAAGCKPS